MLKIETEAAEASGFALIVASSKAQDSIFSWRQDRIKISLVRKNHTLWGSAN
jgi:hypothetical protein